jgi:hypothetical protein
MTYGSLEGVVDAFRVMAKLPVIAEEEDVVAGVQSRHKSTECFYIVFSHTPIAVAEG